MLVLTRKQNESIVIGEDIEIRIARIDGNQVRVGITAPKYVPVYRKEIAPSSVCSNEENARPVAARFSYSTF